MTDESVIELVVAYEQDALSPAQRRRLAARLRSDPALLERFRDELSFGACLAAAVDDDGERLRQRTRFLITAIRAEPEANGLGALPERIRHRPSVRRRAAARRRAGGRRRLLQLGGLLSLAAAITVALLLWSPTSSTSSAAAWRVQVGSIDAHAIGEDWFTVTEETTVIFPDGSQLIYEPDSRARIAERGRRLELTQGRLTATLRPQGDRPLYFFTPHGRVRVIGTRLRLTAGPRRSQVTVSEGALQVHSGAATATIRSGERAVLSEQGGLWTGARAERRLAVIAPRMGSGRDAAAQRSWLQRQIDRCIAHGADWVLTPSMVAVDNRDRDLFDRIAADAVTLADPWLSRLQASAAQNDTTILLATPVQEADRTVVAVVVVDRSGCAIAHRKTNLAGAEAKAGVVAGEDYRPLTLDDWRVGLLISKEAYKGSWQQAYADTDLLLLFNSDVNDHARFEAQLADWRAAGGGISVDCAWRLNDDWRATWAPPERCTVSASDRSWRIIDLAAP